jgi:hypothetical protein
MPRDLPTLNLGQVDDLITSGTDQSDNYFHVYGIFRKETTFRSGFHWFIYDENKEIQIRPAGNYTDYPRPKPGDIIRIHRLRVNSSLKIAEIPMARNVVIWPAFQHEPKPISVARNPTLDENDKTRRRILEAYFCTRIAKLNDIASNRQNDVFYDAVAGRFESVSVDAYGHLEIMFTDGTASMVLRVFCKFKELEDDTHFKIASELKKGQYFVATNVKYDAYKRLNLSANLMHGRSIRPVEQSSILGMKLTESLGAIDQGSSQVTATSNGTQSQPRRSPRLLHQNQDENCPNSQSQAQIDDPAGTTSQIVENFPKFTQFSDIQRKEYGYDFYDLVGQVRDKPRLTSTFGNCLLQIFDGSLHEFTNYFAPDVEHPLDGCLILLVYSKQKESDTNEHFEKAMSLQEGDIIHVTNVKVSFVQGKIKPELSANKSHNKSINKIGKRTPFGRKILNMAETPQVAELRDIIDPVTETSFHESEVDFSEVDVGV